MKKIKFISAIIAPLLVLSGLSGATFNSALAEGSYKLTFENLKGTTDNCAIGGVWDDGKGNGTCTNAYEDSTASGNYCAQFSRTSSSATYICLAWANSEKKAFTEEGTYAVYFKYKTDADASVTKFRFQWQGDYENKQTIRTVPTTWTECYFTMELSSSILGNGTCLFLIESTGNLYIDDLSVIPISRQVVAGAAIGELPNIPKKGEIDGEWQIDGSTITKDTVYNYGQDKTAKMNYPEPGEKYTLTFNGMKGTGDNIDSKGVWPGNDKGTCTNQCSDSTASKGYCGQFTQSGADTFKVFAWANAAGTAFTTAGTYGVCFKYKTSSTDPVSSLKFEWAGDWAIKQTISNLTTEWQECYFTMELDSSNFGNGTCLFDLGSKGTVYIDDFTCILIDKTVTGGQAIGELPEIPSKEGYKGSWQIDGINITKDTVYNYGADKVAVVNYVSDSFKLIFGGTGKAITTNMFAYTSGWWSSSKSNDGHTSDGTYSIVDFNLAGGAVNFSASVYNYQNILKDGNYCMTFDYYAESDVSFNVLHNGEPLVSNLTATNKWQTYSVVYTCLKDKEILKFANSAKTGVVKFTNLIISEIGTSIDLKKGDKIGTLPEVPTKEGTRSYWTIDGVKITSDTIYSYDSNKTAIPTYEYGKKLTFIGNEDDYMKDLTSDVSKWLVVPSIPLQISKENDAITFKGVTKATTRFVDKTNFKLVEGRTYNIKFMVKTGSAKIHFVANAWNKIILTNYSSADWTLVDVNFVAPAPYVDKGEERYGFDLQIINNTDTSAINEVSIKNMVLTSITDEHSYFDEEKITNLPSAPQNSAWVVDNTILEEGMAYPFAGNKQAYMAPVITRGEISSFDYHIDHKLELDVSIKTFYYGETTLEYQWYKDGVGEPTSKPTEIGKYVLKVYAVDCNGTKSIVSADYNVNVLAKDENAPDWIRAEDVFTYPTDLSITVKKGTYAQLNLEAYDELDGFIIVEYDYSSMVDVLGRFIQGEGDITCTAKDLTNNQVQLTIHIIAQ